MDQITIDRLIYIKNEILSIASNKALLNQKIHDLSFIGHFDLRLKDRIKRASDKISNTYDLNEKEKFQEAKTEILEIVDKFIVEHKVGKKQEGVTNFPN